MPYSWGRGCRPPGRQSPHDRRHGSRCGDPETRRVSSTWSGRPPGRAGSGPRGDAHESRAAAGPIRAALIDITNCIGCRACQVACKQWNEREGEGAELEADLGFRTRRRSARRQCTLIAFHGLENEQKPGGPRRHARDAAVPPLPAAGLRLRLPDDGALPAGRQSGLLRRRQVHRLPRCDWPVLGHFFRPRNGIRSRRDLEVHALRRPRRSAGADRVQRKPLSDDAGKLFAGNIAIPACVKACRRRPALRNPRRHAGARAQGGSPTAEIASTTSAERRSWAGERAACRPCRSRALSQYGEKLPAPPKWLWAPFTAVMALGA